jgi:hypothetical protein
MLPQQFAARFAADCGIGDIDLPDYLRCVPRQCHSGSGGLHSNQNGRGTNWNGRWKTWLDGQGRNCTNQAVINFMNQLEQEFAKQFLCIGGPS